MNKVRESIKNVRSKNEYLIFRVEEPYYLIELLENYNRNYIHKHYCENDDEIYILKNDYTGKLIEELGDIGYVRVCNKCGCEVVYDKDLVSYDNVNEYACACLCCDEDLWLIETSVVKNDEYHVTYSFTDEDKKYYIEHECLSDEVCELLEKKGVV